MYRIDYTLDFNTDAGESVIEPDSHDTDTDSADNAPLNRF